MGRRTNRAAVQLAIVWVALASGRAEAADEVDSRLAALEQRVSELRAELGTTTQQHCARMITQARQEAVADSHLAAVLFSYILDTCPQSQHAVVLLDAARTAAASGDNTRAVQRFATAAQAAKRAVELAPSIENLAALAAAGEPLDAVLVTGLPLRGYMEMVGTRGQLDAAGYETLYRLGHALVRARASATAETAETILVAIPDQAPAARRALYLRGVMHLQRGDVAGARPLFDRAAHLPPMIDEEPTLTARDARVRELAWLAVGRLAFEAGDPDPGYYAYQQILVHSPAFANAFLELGWLAMDAGREDLALLAFEPLIDLDPRGEVGRRAGLLKGYVMLHRREYDHARAHYESMGQRYQTALLSFDREVAAIADLADLARDCAVRNRAIANPFLEPLMSRLETEGARRLDLEVVRAARRTRATAEQLSAADDLLAGRRMANPLVALADLQHRAVKALQEVQGLNLAQRQLAARQHWSAGPSSAACCQEPVERLTRLRGHLEGLLLFLEDEERAVRAGLAEIRSTLERSVAAQRASYTELVGHIQEQQRALLRQAIAAARHELHSTAMEGDVGVLEAIWRFKEDHREQIRALEIERKERLAQLADQYDGAVLELDDDEVSSVAP